MDEDLKKLMIDIYNRGYAAGHHDTVEGQYTDIHRSDRLTYHEDVIDVIIDEMLAEKFDGDHANLLFR